MIDKSTYVRPNMRNLSSEDESLLDKEGALAINDAMKIVNMVGDKSTVIRTITPTVAKHIADQNWSNDYKEAVTDMYRAWV